jgi:hypothetical protein
VNESPGSAVRASSSSGSPETSLSSVSWGSVTVTVSVEGVESTSADPGIEAGVPPMTSVRLTCHCALLTSVSPTSTLPPAPG